MINDPNRESTEADDLSNGRNERVATLAAASRADHLNIRPLTRPQERRLIDYLDERFLELTRNFTKRADLGSSKTPTLIKFLEEASHLLAFILQIPPVDPSTSLRIAYLLRLTADAFGSIPGYSLTHRISDPLTPPSSDDPPNVPPEDIRAALRQLLDFLDDLDQAWFAVLRGQVWDPATATGVDLTSLLTSITHSAHDPTTNSSPPLGNTEKKTTPPTQTELSRLRSLIVSGESALEDWLAKQKVAKAYDPRGEADDVAGMLEDMGLLDEFDNLFSSTMDVLGFSDIKQSELEEIPMSDPFSCGPPLGDQDSDML